MIQPTFKPLIIPWSIKIITALAIFIIGRMIAKWLTRMIRKLIGKSGLDEALVKFLGSIIYTVLLVAVILAAIDTLGVNVTSLLAILGAAW